MRHPARTFVQRHAAVVAAWDFAAAIFGFVGCFGESAVPVIMGGVGYQLMGNTITSAMDVLNYPLAAAMSTVVLVGDAGPACSSGIWSSTCGAFLGKILRLARRSGDASRRSATPVRQLVLGL